MHHITPKNPLPQLSSPALKALQLIFAPLLTLFFLCLSPALLRAEPPLTQGIYAQAIYGQTTSGEDFTGNLLQIDPQNRLLFQTPDQNQNQTKTLPLADLVSWGTLREPKRSPLLLLADGSLLAVDELQTRGETLSIESSLFGLHNLTWDHLAGVIFLWPKENAKRDLLLNRLLFSDEKTDQLLLENDDLLTGMLKSIDLDTIQWQNDAGPLSMQRNRVEALLFNPALRRKTDQTPLQTILGLSDGSRLLTTNLQIKNQKLHFRAADQEWQIDLDAAIFLQPLGGNALYLSDLKPTAYQFLPYLDVTWPYRNDRNVNNGLLRVNDTLYLKGLGLQSASRLTYSLDGKFRRFQAELGIDDNTQGQGSVRFHVFVDGKEVFLSDVVRGGQPPKSISIDITGAKVLDLIVDYADRAQVLDHANWLNPRLIK